MIAPRGATEFVEEIFPIGSHRPAPNSGCTGICPGYYDHHMASARPDRLTLRPGLGPGAAVLHARLGSGAKKWGLTPPALKTADRRGSNAVAAEA